MEQVQETIEVNITIAIHQSDWGQVCRLAEQAISSKGLATTLILDSLLQALEWGDFQVRWDVSKMLPKLGNIAIEPLLELLQDDSLDEEIHWFVVQSLGAWNDDSVIQALWQVLQSGHPELQAMAATVLANYGDRILTVIESTDWQSLDSRIWIVRILANIRTMATIDLLLDFATDSNPEVSVSAIEALSGFQDDRIAPILIASIQSTHASLRQAAATAIVFCQSLTIDQQIEYLSSLLWDLNVSVCIKAAMSLGRLGNEAVIPLLKALESKPLPEDLAVELVRSLLRIESQTALTGLLEINDPAEIVRHTVLQGLGQVKILKELSVNYLIKLLQNDVSINDVSITDRRLAVTALGQLKNPTAIEILIQQLAIPDSALRLHILQALQQIDRTLEAPTIRHQIQQQLQNTNLTEDLAADLTIDLIEEKRSGLAFALQEWR